MWHFFLNKYYPRELLDFHRSHKSDRAHIEKRLNECHWSFFLPWRIIYYYLFECRKYLKTFLCEYLVWILCKDFFIYIYFMLIVSAYLPGDISWNHFTVMFVDFPAVIARSGLPPRSQVEKYFVIYMNLIFSAKASWVQSLCFSIDTV